MLDFEITSVTYACLHQGFVYKLIDSGGYVVISRVWTVNGYREVFTDLGVFESVNLVGFDTKRFNTVAEAKDTLCKLLLTKGE